MVWSARLSLNYRRDDDRTIAHDRHEGPLRVLQALYPEGPGICHHVVVHPPGGIVGGDELHIDLQAGAGAHAVVTTPGAAKFYRSAGAEAVQAARLSVADDARVEWLPLESIAYRGCAARNEVTLDLAPRASVLGWDLLALGLPAGREPFDHGRFTQTLHWPGIWLEHGTVDGHDTRLLDSPLGWAGHRVLATAWFAAGTGGSSAQREALLDAARAIAVADGLAVGATSPDPRLVLLRVLAPRVEPAMHAIQAVRAAWRRIAWGLAPHPPRIWRT
jgi:urease accessory protein